MPARSLVEARDLLSSSSSATPHELAQGVQKRATYCRYYYGQYQCYEGLSPGARIGIGESDPLRANQARDAS